MISKEKVTAVRAIPMPEYFKEVMPHVDTDLSEIWSDLMDYGKSLCPFHQEKTPSFRYVEHTNTCYCYACRTGGDTINVHRLLFNVKFDDAVEFLYDYFIGEDVDESKLKHLSMDDKESKAEVLAFNHTVLDKVTSRNFELAEDLSLLLRLHKLTGIQAIDYYLENRVRGV